MWFVALSMVAMIFFSTCVAAVVKAQGVVFRESSGSRAMYRPEVLVWAQGAVEVPQAVLLSLCFTAM